MNVAFAHCGSPDRACASALLALRYMRARRCRSARRRFAAVCTAFGMGAAVHRVHGSRGDTGALALALAAVVAVHGRLRWMFRS